MSANTKRLYLSSADSDETYVAKSGMKIDLSSANIRCKPNEALSVSLVRGNFPSTLTNIGLTSSLRKTVAATLPAAPVDDSCQVLAYGVGQYTGTWDPSKQTIYYIVFNDVNKVNLGQTNTVLSTWNTNTTIKSVIDVMNTQIGTPTMTWATGDQGNLRKLTTLDSSQLVIFLGSYSTPNIMQALGCTSSGITPVGYLSAGGTQQFTPEQFNVSNAGSNIFVQTSLGFQSFISWANGTNANILASIPISSADSISGLQLDSQNYSTAAGQTFLETDNDTQINYVNHALSGSHKPITEDRIGSIELMLVDRRGVPVGTGVADWDVVLELKTITSQ